MVKLFGLWLYFVNLKCQNFVIKLFNEVNKLDYKGHGIIIMINLLCAFQPDVGLSTFENAFLLKFYQILTNRKLLNEENDCFSNILISIFV